MKIDNNPKNEGKSKWKSRTVYGFLIFLFLFCVALIFFKNTLLTSAGRYLIFEKIPEKADLIVCLGGDNIVRGLATADAYKAGLAPMVYISRPEFSENSDLLKKRNIKYPEFTDLLYNLLVDLGIPGESIIRDTTYVNNTRDEAIYVRKEVEKRGFKSLIIITSPSHTRRSYLTFKEVFEGSGVDIYSVPSKYSKYNPEDYWKKRKYLKEVLLEYQKLLYYRLRYHI
jgi:uncharacterized SAM-binding protein YcdF (DUF218 family)